ncbi:MAG: nucleotide exchange factor GrpE [Porticoccaceae bacterium]
MSDEDNKAQDENPDLEDQQTVEDEHREEGAEPQPEPSVDDQLQESREQMLRIQAEMQNVRRRAERDVANAHKFALEKFAGELLPVVDNLERALAAIDSDDETQKAVREGLELTLKSFTDVLNKFDLVAVNPIGEPFDPELSQAMAQVPNPELEPNTVMEVFQKGYTLSGRLLRPAMVVVSKAAE